MSVAGISQSPYSYLPSEEDKHSLSASLLPLSSSLKRSEVADMGRCDQISRTAHSILDQAINHVDLYLGSINRELKALEEVIQDLNNRLRCRRTIAGYTAAIGSTGSLIGGISSGITNDSPITGLAIASLGIIASFVLGSVIRNSGPMSAQYNVSLDRIKQLKSELAKFNALREKHHFLEVAFCLYQSRLDVERGTLDLFFVDFLNDKKNFDDVQKLVEEDITKRTAEAFAKRRQECMTYDSSTGVR